MKSLSATLAMAALAACTAAPPPEMSQPDRILVSSDAGSVHSYDEVAIAGAAFKSTRSVVVPVLKDAYEELGIPVKFADPVTGQVGNNYFIRNSRLGSEPLSKYIRCGNGMTGAIADDYKITMSVVSVVSASGTGSKMDTRVQAIADNPAASGGSIQCQTTGTLEAAVHRVVLRRLGDREAP